MERRVSMFKIWRPFADPFESDKRTSNGSQQQRISNGSDKRTSNESDKHHDEAENNMLLYSINPQKLGHVM